MFANEPLPRLLPGPQSSNGSHRSLRQILFVLALLVTLHFGATMAHAQDQPAAQQPTTPAAQTQAPATPAPVPVTQSAESEGPQALHLLVGRSIVISSPARIKRVSLADPNIAEAIVVSPTQVLVNGRTPGGVSLIIWDESDQSQAFEVSVDIDVLGLSQKIHEVFPSEDVHIETSRDMVMLSGKISSSQVADKILEVVKNTTPKVTSLMQVPPTPTAEILLQVRFAEVNRSLIKQFGINLLSLPGAKNIGTISTQQFAPPQLTTQNTVSTTPSSSTTTTGASTTTTSTTGIGVSDLLNIFIFRPDINLAATIKALQEQNVLEILAEPNLMTASGKDASFLAGGEFPYPILQSTGGNNGFAGITIQFKEFGVRLNFTPTLTPDGLIHLKVKPEVSSLDFTQALTLQGFVIPALATNRVESEMDLTDGQSFAIAGLLDNRVTEQLQKIPGIGDIPILGKLFSSRTLNKSKNELLIVVTPRIVHPVAADKPAPTINFPLPFTGVTNADKPKAANPK
jgi:pilus assembly protein CpaC